MGRQKFKWDDTFYLKCYQLACAGQSQTEIAKSLGVRLATLMDWMDDNPAFRQAWEEGKARTSKSYTFREYVYKRLPDDLKQLWDEINACETLDDPQSRIEALLSGRGKEARQHLFLYALCERNFNPSAACRAINISTGVLKGWISEDPRFKELMDEIHWHKGNFFEEHLVQLVDEGDVSATLFANRTFNKDRGYGETSKVEVNGQINHNHTVVSLTFEDIEKLELDVETRLKLLNAIRAKKLGHGPAPNMQDVTYRAIERKPEEVNRG